MDVLDLNCFIENSSEHNLFCTWEILGQKFWVTLHGYHLCSRSEYVNCSALSTFVQGATSVMKFLMTLLVGWLFGFLISSKDEIKTEDVSKEGQAEDAIEDVDVDVVGADQVIPSYVFWL